MLGAVEALSVSKVVEALLEAEYAVGKHIISSWRGLATQKWEQR